VIYFCSIPREGPRVFWVMRPGTILLEPIVVLSGPRGVSGLPDQMFGANDPTSLVLVLRMIIRNGRD